MNAPPLVPGILLLPEFHLHCHGLFGSVQTLVPVVLHCYGYLSVILLIAGGPSVRQKRNVLSFLAEIPVSKVLPLQQATWERDTGYVDVKCIE